MLQLSNLDIAFVYICSQPWKDHLMSRTGVGSLQTGEILPPWPWQLVLCSSPLRFAASQVSNSQGAAEALCLSPVCLQKHKIVALKRKTLLLQRARLPGYISIA